uniref:Uncharacterized protein n=1 Tax=Zooxanthella nutricula TaxID=1333877 RepID=A0A6U8U7K6_9DINO|mmetsp:Transcript_22004/g.65630  ORF Transcript_22004/g.65630 Transcript_22004/m.65630 type:complete len:388 (+) Transcript_22004:63-1226(+)
MKLEQYRTMWGNLDSTDGLLARAPHHTIEQIVPALAELGYDGIEIPFKCALFLGAEKLKGLLQTHNMRLTIMVFTDNVVVPGEGILWGGPYPGFTSPTSGEEMAKCLAGQLDGSNDPALAEQVVRTHTAVFKEQVQAAYKTFGDLLSKVISHSLKDNFPFEMAATFFRDALQWEEENGYVVCHETHRKRFLHSPWATLAFFKRYPEIFAKIKLCADLSHWINVAETDTADPVLNQAIAIIAPKVHHTHCRVGYDHGPQVPDPRAPEWLPYMEGHERWWDLIWREQAKRGDAVATMIAEHGPPSYQQTLPYSKEPVAFIWDVNHWIHLRRQLRFEQIFGSADMPAEAPERGERPCEGAPPKRLKSGAPHASSNLVPSATQGFDPPTAP